MPSPAQSTPALRLARLKLAAPYGNVSIRTLHRWISEGRLTGYRSGPRILLVDLNELDRLIRVVPTARTIADGTAGQCIGVA
jgi:excisionase family DNA binding protein